MRSAALTGQWAGLPAYPGPTAVARQASIVFRVSQRARSGKNISISYDWGLQDWPVPRSRPTIPGLSVYACVDGSFAVWDPMRDYRPVYPPALPLRSTRCPSCLMPNRFGKLPSDRDQGRSVVYSNGLIRDRITWQNSPQRYPFETFSRVLRRRPPRSPAHRARAACAILPGDARDIPTIGPRIRRGAHRARGGSEYAALLPWPTSSCGPGTSIRPKRSCCTSPYREEWLS